MWEELPQIKELLTKKRYNQAADSMKRSITCAIEEDQQIELISFLRKEMLLLNLSGDSNLTSLFCEKLIKHCLNLGLDIAEYAEQCRVLNNELDWYGEQYKLVVRELHSLHPITALHVILSTFENLNQYLLSSKPDEMERIFYASYVYGMESNYESGISALNLLLKLWINGNNNGVFQGRFNGLPYVAESHTELREQLAPIIRSLNYLQWLCKQVSLHFVSMEVNESEVTFKILNKDEYIHYKLPSIRETARMHNTLRTFPIVKQRFSWKKEEIDYNKIIEIKDSGDDFRLHIDPDTFFEAFKTSTEVAYQSHLHIIEDMFITNLDEMKIRDKNVNVMDMFFFYYCLKTFGLIYFQATQHFIQTSGKEARAPYLNTDRYTIVRQFTPILTNILKRKVEENEIHRMIDLFTFGGDNIFDLYYKPIVAIGDTVVIIPSIFMMNNFSKTFLHHMNTLNVNLADRGTGFENVMQSLFEKHEFSVYPSQLPYSYDYEDKRINGDIDLIAKKGDYLYLGQLKNRLEPIEPKDYRGADKKINQGVNQAEQARLYIMRNPDEFCKRFGITREELDKLIIQPFVLVSCFYGSGQHIRDIPVIDASALFRFLNEGKINIYLGEGEPYSRLLRTSGEVIPEEFNQFLSNPYFLDPEVYGVQTATRHVYFIRDKKFSIGPDEDWHDQYDKSFIAKAVQHFEKAGLLDFSE